MLKPFQVWLGLFVLLAMGTGCATSSITNLTPSDFPRFDSGLYRIEAAWRSNQRSIQEDTIEPVVIVGTTHYPMQPVPYAEGRWETMVPVKPDQEVIHYHFKFNFIYSAVPEGRPNSKRSPEYRLDIVSEEL
ncbi:MAG: hypothetical protein M2R45_03786 [Verrucomicrobia subdivision 3 bacterium]|nr:hypothetical protein [Limisphaerales bacterium]MCS1416773.1 hypothetical protein [Limisphaerales bacterium]